MKRLKKEPLTFEEHDALGAELQTIRDRLGKIAVRLERAYRKEIMREALKAQRVTDGLRALLDDRVYAENHGSGKNLSLVYFRNGTGI